MYLDNPVIVLISSYVLKNENDITTYKQLQQFLPLEKSQISQALKTNEETGLLQKPKGNKYFSTIQITSSGIQKAQRYIAFLEKLIKISPSPSPKKLKSIPTKPPPNINSFVDKLSTTLFSPLKSSLKKSLQDYIPDSRLDKNMVDDLADAILSFIDKHLTIK